MATFSRLDRYNFGNKRIVLGTLTMSNSYTTGGEALTPAQVGLRAILHVDTGGVLSTASGTTAQAVNYNFATGKVQAYNGDAGTSGPLAEVAATTNLSTMSTRVQIYGY